MTLDIATLLFKAQCAQPETTARPRRWARLWPVYAALRARGFSCQRAVEWLTREGQVPRDEQTRALNAFHILATRRNKKASAAAQEPVG